MSLDRAYAAIIELDLPIFGHPTRGKPLFSRVAEEPGGMRNRLAVGKGGQQPRNRGTQNRLAVGESGPGGIAPTPA
jgi:hypothetical protein